MPSITFQKELMKEEVSRYFEAYLPTLSNDELREFTMSCIRLIAAKMSLKELQGWVDKIYNEGTGS